MDEVILKQCTYCQQQKPLSEFHKNRNSKDGHANKCKDCESKGHHLYYINKKAGRKSKLKTNYNMAISDFNRMYKEQNGRCAICEVEDAKFVVDHDHITGFPRGLLCPTCNHLLGRAKDNINTLQKAIAYLERSNELQRETITEG